MKKVAKLIIIDGQGDYLLIYRNQHPTFGNDPDLPGGTLETGEAPLETMLREVQEEIGVAVNEDVQELYAGTEYSSRGTHYSLFVTNVGERPEIAVSWEHSGYKWVSRDDFLAQASTANDVYMKMVYEVARDRL